MTAPMGDRRVDELRCSSAEAAERVDMLVKKIQSRVAEAKQEVTDACKERIAALTKRQQELIRQIDEVARTKMGLLNEQLGAIEAGACAPAPAEHEDEEPDPDVFLLDADPVINFKVLPDKDFLEAIPSFGGIDEFSTYASNSYAKGPALGVLKVGKPSFLWVYACDREGFRRKEGGDLISVKASVAEAFGNLDVQDLKDGRYKVTFLPLQEGNFDLEVAIGPEGSQELIRGAPLPLVVRQPTAYQEIGVGYDTGKGKVGGTGLPCHSDEIGLVQHPSGAAFDDSGKFIILCDQANHRMQIFSADDCQPLSCYGKKGFSSADFNSPCDVCVDRFNCVVVSDLLNHRLQVFDFLPRANPPQLRHRRTLCSKGEGEGQFVFPRGVGLTENSQLLVCDSGNHRVQVFDMNEGAFSFVREIGRKATPEDIKKGQIDGTFDTPLDVAVDRDGNILVSDQTHRIQVFDIDGNFIKSFGSKGHKDGMFRFPTNLAVDDENALYICDQGNHRVQVIDASDGTFLHKWGGSKKAPAAEGEGEEAPPAEEGEEGPKEEWVGIRSPAGIAVSTTGMVVISDYAHNEIFVF